MAVAVGVMVMSEVVAEANVLTGRAREGSVTASDEVPVFERSADPEIS